jgi:protein O-mannosyl-transferase
MVAERSHTGEDSDWSRADRIALVLILAWVAICFAQTLGFDFVNWDDRDLVLTNPLILRPGSVPLWHHLTTPEIGYPTAVTMASYRIEHALVGFDHPWLQHATNLAFHLGSVALLFSIARLVGLATLGAAVAATVLGLHPAASEPVAWLTGRKDVLALFFALVAVRLALPLSAQPSRVRRAARAVAFLLALFAKPVAVALAPVFVLLAFAHRDDDRPWYRRLGAALAANTAELVIAALFIPLAYVSHRAFGGLREGEEVSASLRSAWYGAGVHLAIVLGIEPPCVRHVVASMPPPFSPLFDLLPAAVGLALVALLRRLDARRRALVGLALASSLSAYLPSSGLVPMRRFIADSYVYPTLPGVGLALAAALEALLAHFSNRVRLLHRLAVPGLALVLGLLAFPAAGRFRTTRDLWADALERYPDYWPACRNWAVAMQEIGGPAKTLEATDQCIARFGVANFEKNRAVALFELGRQDEAASWMRQALARDPSDRHAPAALLELAQAGASDPKPAK